MQKLIKVYYNISTNKLNITHKYSNFSNSKISISNNVYNKNLLKGVQTMNKKILSIFVMVMALSLLGVSCNKKTTDPTNNGGSTGPTTVTATQETLKKAALAGLATAAGVGVKKTIDAHQDNKEANRVNERANDIIQSATNEYEDTPKIPTKQNK